MVTYVERGLVVSGQVRPSSVHPSYKAEETQRASFSGTAYLSEASDEFVLSEISSW